jgi:hypothetical protein
VSGSASQLAKRNPGELSRRLVVRQSIIGISIFVAIVFLLPISIWYFTQSGSGNSITEQQYQALRFGEPQAEVTGTLGSASTQSNPASKYLPPVPAKVECGYYYEIDTTTSGNVYRVCYIADRLVAKSEYGGPPSATCPAPGDAAEKKPPIPVAPWDVSVTCLPDR